MVYGVYNDWYVTLCLHDYLDTESDILVQAKDLEIVNNDDFYVIETWERIIYITAWDEESALECVDWILLDNEKVITIEHCINFLE